MLSSLAPSSSLVSYECRGFFILGMDGENLIGRERGQMAPCSIASLGLTLFAFGLSSENHTKKTVDKKGEGGKKNTVASGLPRM